jgi:hypothetical protein
MMGRHNSIESVETTSEDANSSSISESSEEDVDDDEEDSDDNNLITMLKLQLEQKNQQPRNNETSKRLRYRRDYRRPLHGLNHQGVEASKLQSGLCSIPEDCQARYMYATAVEDEEVEAIYHRSPVTIANGYRPRPQQFTVG